MMDSSSTTQRFFEQFFSILLPASERQWEIPTDSVFYKTLRGRFLKTAKHKKVSYAEVLSELAFEDLAKARVRSPSRPPMALAAGRNPGRPHLHQLSVAHCSALHCTEGKPPLASRQK